MGAQKINIPGVGNVPKDGKTGVAEFDAAKSFFDKTLKKLKGVDRAKLLKTISDPKAMVQIHKNAIKQAGLGSVYGGLEAAELWGRMTKTLTFLGTSRGDAFKPNSLTYIKDKFERESGLNLNRKSAQVGRFVGLQETGKAIARPVVLLPIAEPSAIIAFPAGMRAGGEVIIRNRW